MKQRDTARKISLLVFDWDGTLVDSIGTIVECAQESLRELGLPAVADREIRRAIGLGLRETVESLSPGCDDRLFERIVETYRHLWFGGYLDQVGLFPGARKTLEKLLSRGYLFAIATAKSRKGLAHDLEATRLSDMFHATRTVDEARSKPHPEMLLGILDELGTAPPQAVMIGDSEHDLQMAHNAGVVSVAVASGSRSRESLEAVGPAVCLDSVNDFPEWLSRWEINLEDD